MKEPIDYFLSGLENTIYYDVIRMAIFSDLHIKEIAEEYDLKPKTCEYRIYCGALKLGILSGRTGLKTAYIEFLEDWIKARGIK